MYKVKMSRINHHLPRALHKQIRDIAFDNDESTTIAINRAIENYVNSFGSEPVEEAVANMKAQGCKDIKVTRVEIQS